MEHRTDFLVIGSGIAGLSFALKASRYGKVTVVTKKGRIESNTNYAQGGIAAVLSKDDAFINHQEDTLRVGDGLCHPEIVEMVVKDGPVRIKELAEWGVNFSLSKEGEGKNYDLGREGGHSKRRVAHVLDFTGREIENILVDKIEKNPQINIFENHTAVDLLMKSKAVGHNAKEQNGCLGAYVLDVEKGVISTFTAKITVLATGGAGKVYLYTSNPDIATGDGIAMAYRAGAAVANLEFVQFHPTCLYHPKAKSFLISETMRGEGGILRKIDGSTFMEKYHAMRELAPRDIVARAIDSEMKRTGDEHVLLDVTHKKPFFIKERFPQIFQKCLSFGIDITKQPIPVVPAAHYICGGVLTDKDGQTSIERLYACGECACTGLHGANRLASNSLLEALVIAHRVFLKSIQDLQKNEFSFPPVEPWDTMGATDSDETVVISQNWDEIRMFMWNYVGIVRSNKRLARAKRRIEMIQKEIAEYYRNFIVTNDLVELRNIATVAEIIINSACLRKESRGLHYNIDYPEKDENKKGDTVLTRKMIHSC